jgi:hypothetical protein
MNWIKFKPCDLGFLPELLSEYDLRPAASQLADNYRHGGGWNPQHGFTFGEQDCSLKYPGDPVMFPLARSKLRDELLLFYEYAYLCIVQPDMTFEVARVD